MNKDQHTPDTRQVAAELQQVEDQARQAEQADFDGLAGKKPEDLTPEELRLMADTMPGEGPGD